jgi:hypothetical protein
MKELKAVVCIFVLFSVIAVLVFSSPDSEPFAENLISKSPGELSTDADKDF